MSPNAAHIVNVLKNKQEDLKKLIMTKKPTKIINDYQHNNSMFPFIDGTPPMSQTWRHVL